MLGCEEHIKDKNLKPVDHSKCDGIAYYLCYQSNEFILSRMQLLKVYIISKLRGKLQVKSHFVLLDRTMFS